MQPFGRSSVETEVPCQLCVQCRMLCAGHYPDSLVCARFCTCVRISSEGCAHCTHWCNVLMREQSTAYQPLLMQVEHKARFAGRMQGSRTSLTCVQGLNDRQLAWMGLGGSRHCQQGRGRCSPSARSSLLRGQARAGPDSPGGPTSGHGRMMSQILSPAQRRLICLSSS